MPGGISYVLERVLQKKSRAHAAGRTERPLLPWDSRTAHGSKMYSATKGSYTAQLIFDALGRRQQFELTHYGTMILSVNYKHKDITGGWNTVSSSGAINKALNALDIPCHWSHSSKGYGFWCKEGEGWTGDPSGPKSQETETKIREHRKKVNAEARRMARPGGVFKIPGRKYSPLAKRKMADLQEELMGSQRFWNG